MSKKVNIVDIETHFTSKDIYYVAKSMNNKQSRILVTNNLAEAIQKVNEQTDVYYVYNSKGKILYCKPKTTKTVKVNVNRHIHADGINIYSSAEDSFPTRAYHDTLIIVDDRLYCDKYKVQTDEEFPRTYFCKSDDIKKYIAKII